MSIRIYMNAQEKSRYLRQTNKRWIIDDLEDARKYIKWAEEETCSETAQYYLSLAVGLLVRANANREQSLSK